MDVLLMQKMNRWWTGEDGRDYVLYRHTSHPSAITTVAKVMAAIAPVAVRFNQHGIKKNAQEMIRAQFLGGDNS